MSTAHLSLPHGFQDGDTSAPVLLLLHGTGGGPQDLVEVGHHLSPTSALLAPAGPVSESGAARWFRRRAEGVFDEEDVVARTHELAEFVVGAREYYGLTERRLVAVGFSNGANIAAALTLLRPDVLRETIAFASMLPVADPEVRDLTGTRALLSNGERDPMAPVDSADRLVRTLRERNAEVTAHRHPDGHEITREGLQQAAQWIQTRG